MTMNIKELQKLFAQMYVTDMADTYAEYLAQPLGLPRDFRILMLQFSKRVSRLYPQLTFEEEHAILLPIMQGPLDELERMIRVMPSGYWRAELRQAYRDRTKGGDTNDQGR